MGFDLKKFEKTKFVERTDTVKIKGEPLKAMFADGDTPEFTVRGLTGEEMARCNEAQSRQKKMSDVAEAMAGEGGAERVQAIRESMGLSQGDVPADLARRIEMLCHGCVDPKLDLMAAKKVFKVSTVDGYDLSNKILHLSGQGMQVGERKASGGGGTSAQPATSDTPEAK